MRSGIVRGFVGLHQESGLRQTADGDSRRVAFAQSVPTVWLTLGTVIHSKLRTKEKQQMMTPKRSGVCQWSVPGRGMNDIEWVVCVLDGNRQGGVCEGWYQQGGVCGWMAPAGWCAGGTGRVVCAVDGNWAGVVCAVDGTAGWCVRLDGTGRVKEYNNAVSKAGLCWPAGPAVSLDMSSLTRGCGYGCTHGCTQDGIHYHNATYDVVTQQALNILKQLFPSATGPPSLQC
ncbi:hypothetical protein CYMTET_23984 [Cymbomonas tetramitiformis]|uniref:Uncharacterized protein n=1 Tax=Cymbomonas tetramitiformis TaxID=36881 RepID=A0AAE0FX08_9CHLO|nr:hypothetical protein CYMTET_23984 [Cymbomonas tetramitiformis]